MAIRQTSDSLSRCDPNLYANLYEVKKRTDIQTETISSTPTIHKDTLAVSHEKLKKEALGRLRHTSKYLLFQNGFMRVGKYLFLAVAFPPYLILYGIPKWIFVEGIPALMTFCLKISAKVEQKVKKRLELVTQKIRQTVQFIQAVVQAFIRPIIRLTLDIQQAFHRLRTSAQGFFKSFTDKVKVTLKYPGAKIIDLAKRLQTQSKRIQKWISDQTTLVLNKGQEGLNWIKEIPQMGLVWGASQFEKFSNQAKKVRQKWQAKLQTSQAIAQQTTEWLSKQLSQGKQVIKRNLDSLKTIYQEWLKPNLQEMGSFCKRQLSRSRHFFNQKREQALHFLNQAQEHLKGVSFQQFFDWLTPAFFLKGQLGRFQQMIKTIMTHRAFQTALKALFTISSVLLIRLMQFFSFLIKEITKVLQLFSAVKNWIIQASKNTCQQGLSGIKTGLAIIGKVFEKGGHRFLVFLIMAGIVTMWGFQLLGEKMYSLTAKYLFKRQNSSKAS